MFWVKALRAVNFLPLFTPLNSGLILAVQFLVKRALDLWLILS